MGKQRIHYLQRNGYSKEEMEYKRAAGFNVAKELLYRDYDVQRQVQRSCIDVSQSCPGYKDIIIPVRPRYLREKGDGNILKKIARRRCQVHKYWEKKAEN
jgi:hypothetical protein